MSNPSEAAVHLEAVLIAMNKTKDGFKTVFVIHPSDCPEELLRAPVGSRYMMALVQLDERDQPIFTTPRPKDDGAEAVQYAGRLCKEPAFMRWFWRRGFCSAPNEERVSEGLRVALKIASRSELATNETARREFYEFANQYLKDTG